MPTESELRAVLRDTSSGAGPSNVPGLDSDTIIRRARGRRRPRQLAFGSVAALAVAGFVYVGASAIPWPQSVVMSGADSLQDASTGAELSSPEVPAAAQDPAGGGQEPSAINRCGRPLAGSSATQSGLVLTSDFPSTGTSNGLPVQGTVTLTNKGSKRVTGMTDAQPTVVLSRDGITVWHTNGGTRSIEYLVDLAPGQSKEFSATFTPVLCTPADDDLPLFPGDLPPLGPGTYQVTVLLDLRPVAAEDGGMLNGPVSGPAQDFAITGG